MPGNYTSVDGSGAAQRAVWRPQLAGTGDAITRLFPNPCSFFQTLLHVEEGNFSLSVSVKGAWNISSSDGQDAKYQSPSHSLGMKESKGTKGAQGKRGGRTGRTRKAATRKPRTGKQKGNRETPSAGAAGEPASRVHRGLDEKCPP